MDYVQMAVQNRLRYHMFMMYRTVCVAGTFDGIHAGHEALLTKAFAIGERVLVGLTSDAFVKRYKASQTRVSTYTDRYKAVTNWLVSNGFTDRATVIPIDDPFEPAVSAKDVDALVVSEESKKRGAALNQKRIRSGLKPLKLIVVPMVQAEDKKPISSSRVRRGEVDAGGRLTMPDNMRDELAQPLGKVLPTAALQDESFARNCGKLIVTVGDLTTKTLLDLDITPCLMIVDGRVGRKAFPDLQPIFRKRGFTKTSVDSGPGYISENVITVIHTFFKSYNSQPLGSELKSLVIEVKGEEDLLALPVIANAPLGAVVYYGQPPIAAWACGPVTKGIVEVRVTSEKQQDVTALLQKFLR